MKLSVKPKKGNRGGARAVGKRSPFGDAKIDRISLSVPTDKAEEIRKKIINEILIHYYKK